MNQIIRLTFIIGSIWAVSAYANAQTDAPAANNGGSHRSDSAEVYVLTPQIIPQQSQLIYYYPKSINAGPLNIYVDKEFHKALIPGEFTAICLKAGTHYINAVVNDAPVYKQKTDGGVFAKFVGGKTYFARVGMRDTVVSESVYPADAARELQGFHKNTRIVNRASSVESCQYINSSPTSSNIVLFKFGGSSYAQMEPDSQQRLNALIQNLKNSTSVKSIYLTGFTDGIGKVSSNQRLSLARAEAVRHRMVVAGIDPARINVRGDGVATTAEGCSAHSSDGCNKNSRRVEIRLNGQ